MLGIMQSSTQDSDDGRVKVSLTTSTNLGYTNLLAEQYNDYGHYSVPLPGQLVNMEQEAWSNVYVTGYNNTIVDANFIATPGSSTNWGATADEDGIVTYHWYQTRDSTGVYIQEAHTVNREPEMMGQSTNNILIDMVNLLVEIITYLQSVESLYNAHTHIVTGITSGSSATTSNATTSLFTSPPDDTKVNNDLPRLNNKNNLALTAKYIPYEG